ncbi:hypothetical protein [Enterobacter sp.]|uniref:hypothetical protein n=1 Tax=Enterobacter sp. TaxID=42895 RepID=UPI00296F4C57|nr:hypothetical protein [Enterobacter sp.]
MTFKEITYIFTITAHGNHEQLHDFSKHIGKTPRLEITEINITPDQEKNKLILKYKSAKEHGRDFFDALAEGYGVSIFNFEKTAA